MACRFLWPIKFILVLNKINMKGRIVIGEGEMDEAPMLYVNELVGNNIGEEEVPQYVVPAGTWFASELENKNEFALCGCTVSPGFDFNDFEMPEKNQLLKLFPLHEEIINRLGYSKK